MKTQFDKFVSCLPLAVSTWKLFFLIGNKDIYSRTLPYAEKHKAARKIQREKKKYKDNERKRY